VDRRQFLRGALLALIGGIVTEERFLGRKDITSDVRRIQAMFGTLYAGGGVVILDASGVRIRVPIAPADLNSYRFVNAADTVISQLMAYYDIGANLNGLTLTANSVAACGSVLWLRAEAPAGFRASSQLCAYRNAGTRSDILCNVSNADVSTITAYIDWVTRFGIHSTGVDVVGDLNVSGSIITSTAIGARVERTSDLAIADATWTAVTWNTERVDTDGIWAAGTPTRFTPQTAGYYTVEGSINFLSNAAGFRSVAVRLNGTTVVRMQQSAAINGADTALAVTAGMHLFNGTTDYAEIMVYQNSGGALNLNYVAANWEFIQASITRQA